MNNIVEQSLLDEIKRLKEEPLNIAMIELKGVRDELDAAKEEIERLKLELTETIDMYTETINTLKTEITEITKSNKNSIPTSKASFVGVLINNAYYHNEEYITFKKTYRSNILEFLIANIIRKPECIGNMPIKIKEIHKKFLSDGKLVSRYSQENIAKIFKTDSSKISKEIKQLEDEGWLKRVLLPCPSNLRLKETYYVLGTTTKTNNKLSETLYFDTKCNEMLDKAHELKLIKNKEIMEEVYGADAYEKIDTI
jgi:DNA-binding MarR family transcriptional regulator